MFDIVHDRKNCIFRVLWGGLLTVLTGFACFASFAVLQAEDASSLRLVPFPKQVELDQAKPFTFKNNLQLMIPEKEQSLLQPIIIEELKRAGFPEPQILVIRSDVSRVVLAKPDTNLIDPKLPEQAGEGKSDPGEAYAVSVTPEGIVCLGNDSTGLFYAVQTLCQLIRANVNEAGEIPCMTIQDWPSMKYRCFQDDLTRGPSPHLETLLFESDMGSQLKHNMFTYYMEDQYEFKKHPKISPKDGSLMQEDFKKWIEYAAKRHLIILGNQQSFGHFYKQLAIPEYAHLGEAGYILSPAVEEVYPFLDDLYSEIIPNLPFGMFNVCCDETADLAKSGPSKDMADEIGVGGVYVKHILRVYELLKKYDKRMMMWGDIIMNHPVELEQIPKDVVMMCWDYASRPDYDEFIKPFSSSGYDFCVCPGQSNWSVMLPLITQSTVNIKNFVRDGCKYGAIGMLNTGWEDDGEAIHGYNWYPIAWGAECSWNASKTDVADFNRRVGPVLFGVKGDEFCRAIKLLNELQDSPELGNAYNRRFWERDFTPKSPPQAIEKNAKRILELVEPAIAYLETTQQQATVNAHLIDSFLLGARKMQLIATRMLDGLEAARMYQTLALISMDTPVSKQEAEQKLTEIEKLIAKNRNAHEALKDEFVRIWNSESKPYRLDRVTKKYEDLHQWFLDLEAKVREVRNNYVDGVSEELFPDIGLNFTSFSRRAIPNKIMRTTLAEDVSWANKESSYRIGVTVDAGDVDRTWLPVELLVNVPEEGRNHQVQAFLTTSQNQTIQIPAQLDSPNDESLNPLTFLIPKLKKGETAKVHVYFGVKNIKPPLGSVSVVESSKEKMIVENNLIQIQIGSEGGHIYKWLVKDFDNLDMTDPGENDYHGFCDYSSFGRNARLDLELLNNGPAMVRVGCFRNGNPVKILTIYAESPIVDVITMSPTYVYWNFDNPDCFAADGKTPGAFLFANGKTGPTPRAGSTTDLQTREKDVPWVIKFNEKKLAHGMTIPETTSTFVIGPGGGMGGVGIESDETPRSHFITFAGKLRTTPKEEMIQIQETYNLKNLPVVALFTREYFNKGLTGK